MAAFLAVLRGQVRAHPHEALRLLYDIGIHEGRMIHLAARDTPVGEIDQHRLSLRGGETAELRRIERLKNLYRRRFRARIDHEDERATTAITPIPLRITRNGRQLRPAARNEAEENSNPRPRKYGRIRVIR